MRIAIHAAILLMCGCNGVKTPVQPSAEPVVQTSVSPQPTSVASPLVTPGDYLVTITADPRCDLPEFAKQRKFAARIYHDPWDPGLDGKITNATIRSAEYYDFWLEDETVDSQEFYIANYGENFGIMEEVGQGLVLLSGKALVTPNDSKMSGDVDGTIGYCPGPARPGLVPSEACRNPPLICRSEKHHVDLERRSGSSASR